MPKAALEFRSELLLRTEYTSRWTFSLVGFHALLTKDMVAWEAGLSLSLSLLQQ